MAKRIAVVVSQGQSQNPGKRSLEEDIVAALMMEPGVDVTVIPHLYDLKADGTGMLALDGIKANMVVLSWLYERAAHWVLDRNGIHGHIGQTLIKMESDDDEENRPDDDKDRVVDHRDIPDRRIFCVDLRVHNKSEPYVEEVRRIAQETNQQLVQLGGWIHGEGTPEQMQRFEAPTNTTALGGNGASLAEPAKPAPANVVRVEESAGRRWYPVIDYSRCTNCMECIDFCLFGVYGVDKSETILVEQPDNCRKGCPACSRVCPENAIIFPQHKTPAIAGSSVVSEGLKIDLSKLFGAPDEGKSAAEIAAMERDEQLVLSGREAVGTIVGVPKRQEGKPQSPKDDLDDLVDALDDMDL